MNFLHAHYLWFLSILVIPIIIRLRKKKHQVLPVPNLQFWLSENEKLTRNRWTFHLRDLLYLVPLLLLFFIANLSLTEPYHGKISQEKHYTIIVDTSPTMTALDGQKTRLQQAQELIQKMSLPTTTIFTTHKIPKVVMAKDIPNLQVENSDIEKSFALIDNFDQQQESIILFTDGTNKKWPQIIRKLAKKHQDNFVVKTLGIYHENAGIYVEKLDANKVTIRIYHDYKQTTNTRILWGKIDKETEDVVEYYQKKVTLEPGRALSESFTLKTGNWKFHLDLQESFSTDNLCTQQIVEKNKCKILVVAEQKIPTFMAALGVYQNLVDLKKSSFTTDISKGQTFDLAFIHSKKWVFPKKPNFNKAVIWNSKGNFLPYNPKILEKNQNFRNMIHHPLMQNIDFSLLTTKMAHLYTHGKRSLVSHTEGALMWEDSFRGVPFIYMGFPLQNSNIAFLPSFPVFIKNLITWATPPQPKIQLSSSNKVVLKNYIDLVDKPLPSPPSKPVYLQWYLIVGVYILTILSLMYFWQKR